MQTWESSPPEPLFATPSFSFSILCTPIFYESNKKKILLPPFQNTCRHLLFSVALTIHLIQKIVQVQFILFVICCNVVCILSLTYRFTCLR
jgi:hypothetical protein